ncbi:dUTP diphosphatase [Cytobacillus spongiae]|jgi:dimeric dUTPase (all-alpha-NTP-PPase superfamily)|uniref:dUTP diphosphatase n=1 Tax=Cytobacillus spongiae TaxID=2901381 RepID=UPI001F463B12|nr:dUTP diphosphatase [Cytobacillus spongiae]UII55127.1 dUTP diphosphatase [Cytobacillus spongiae]
MNLVKLFEMQRGLDKHIETKHNLMDEDLFNRKALALLVEIGELANETRCFKFWSVKPSSSNEVILEEFVDGIHFILSLGIECGYERLEFTKREFNKDVALTDQFLQVYSLIHQFGKSRLIEDYQKLFQNYLYLAMLLGFTEDDIEQAYIKKNEVNYERQQQGY